MNNNSNPKHRFGTRAMLLVVSVFGAVNALAVTVPKDNAPLQDERLQRLEAFFRSYRCPAPHHASEYVGAADTYEIDYRLLPAISVLESTCGVHQRQNNRWGWDSARKGFSSFRAGLEYIARQLSQSRYYKDKSLEEKVRMYNPSPRYARLLNKLMRTIEDRTVVSLNGTPPPFRVQFGLGILSEWRLGSGVACGPGAFLDRPSLSSSPNHGGECAAIEAAHSPRQSAEYSRPDQFEFRWDQLVDRYAGDLISGVWAPQLRIHGRHLSNASLLRRYRPANIS